MNKYKYIVVPRAEHSNEIIGKMLLAISAFDRNQATFTVNKFEKIGYFIRHDFLTTLIK